MNAYLDLLNDDSLINSLNNYNNNQSKILLELTVVSNLFQMTLPENMNKVVLIKGDIFLPGCDLIAVNNQYRL